MARRKDGSASYLEVSLSRWVSQSRVLITAILRDVNERRVAQEILRDSEAQFRTLAQAMPNHVWTARPDGQLDWFNERVYEYSGVEVRNARRRMDGAPLFIPTIGRPPPSFGGRRLRLARRMKRNFGSEARAGVYRWHLARAFPTRGAYGAILRWVGSNTDIEDQKVAAQTLADVNATLEQRVSERTSQLMQAEEALRQSQKMEARGAAHRRHRSRLQ